MINKNRYIRWVLLAVGLTAILGLTAMNVFSLYALHDNVAKNSVENQKRQLLEFSNQVKNRIHYPEVHLRGLDMQKIQASITAPGEVPSEILNIISKAGNDSIFSNIYLALPEVNPSVHNNVPLWRFHSGTGRFYESVAYSRNVTDGLILAKTRMNAILSDYRMSTRAMFDSHKTMVVSMINPRTQQIIAYLIFEIDSIFLVKNYIEPKMRSKFGKSEDSGIVVWLHDWTQNAVLATTDSGFEYSSRLVNHIQLFPYLLHDWNLKATFTNNPEVAASQASLMRNLLALGIAVLLLIGALMFIFFAAQRERLLAQRQSLFLANVTHELQTPLSVILAAGENLSDGRVTQIDRVKSYGSHILHESVRLRTMIERLLDVARSDNKTIRVKKEWVSVTEKTKELLESKEGLLKQHQVRLHFEANPDVPELYIDPADFFSAMDNLIDNALKYGKDGKYLGISIHSAPDQIEISVEDFGVGISRQDQRYIFEKFFRVEDALTAHTKGHGLGLAIVKDIMSRYGGSIRVESS
ncbi:HAMP domain-containing sensor histidine kinase, partial [Balneolaceae bacterium ANBcel3]|nr:HAMP domain-containing sensor histidine kinase [Balneolaceae bacterium ANBcel3]